MTTQNLSPTQPMQAVIRNAYGSAEMLKLASLERPTYREHEVLIRVRATSINAADVHFLHGTPFFLRLASGLFKPSSPLLGADMAGTIEAVGSQVKRFKVGDEVFGDLSGAGLGGFAEYACAPEKILARKPAGISFAQAAAVPMAACTALKALRDKGQIQAGQKVLIYGASGGVGTFALQLAKHFGTEVTASGHPAKHDFLRNLGADYVVNHAQALKVSYDLIIAVGGNHSLREYRQALRRGGRCVVVGGALRQILSATIFGSIVSSREQKIMGMLAQPSAADLEYLGQLLEENKIKPILDKTYRLSQLPEAMRHFEQGQAKGKIVIEL